MAERLRENAYLNKGMNIELVDERTNKRQQFCYEGGIADFVANITADKKPLFVPPVYIEGEVD